MKLSLIFLLLGLCIMSGMASGKKFVCENDTTQFESCETSDSTESDAPTLHSLYNQSSSHINHSLIYTLIIARFRHLARPMMPIHLEFFTPPPEV